MEPSAGPASPDATHHRLAAFLDARRASILGLWKDALRLNRRAGRAPTVDDPGLIDHLPRLFDDLVAGLRGEPAASGQASEDARRHGQARWDQDYTLEEVLRELGIVSRLLFEHGFDVFADTHAGIGRNLLRPARETILGFFEATASGSARQYVARQQERADHAHQETHREERRQAAAVQSDYDRLAGMFQRSPSFLAVLRGPEHTFHLANDQYRRICGHRELIGKPVREALPEVVAQGYVDLLDRVYATGEPFVGTDMRVFVQSEPDAPPREHFIDFVYLPTRREDGGIDGIVVHGVDWTERKRSEAARRESEEQFRQLADSMPQIVWTARPDGVLDYTNRRWYEYIQRGEAEWDVANWGERVHPDDLGRVAQVWQASLASGEAYAAEFRVQRGDGAYRWFLVRALPVRDERGSVARWFGTCTDVHDQRALLEQNSQLLESERTARAQAERASHMKDEFLATLSHELRTPLNAILGWTQVLRGDPGGAEDMAAGLATIERNARAQTQIIEDLLDMSKIISGKVRLDVQTLQLDQVVGAAVESMRPAATAKGIRLQALIDPEARMISGDPNRLQQVFWNLLSNALKFTPRGGQVQVVLARVSSHLEVSVADTGEGIDAEFLPYVFDRFRQQDASTTRRHGGLGLGLAIVKQLVELHGGGIRAESAGPGRGTTFCVRLPLSVVQSAREEAGPARRHPQGAEEALSVPSALLDLAGVKVLVVDDEPDARALVKRLLEDRQATVRTAGSAAEALASLRAERPDVLVSDIGMPGEDGYALIRRVRALGAGEGGGTPAIALTAYARAEDRLKAILAGFEMHVSKPVNTVELLALVAKLAGRVGGF